MIASRDGAYGNLIGAAVGTLLLVLACGAPQDAESVSCADLGSFADVPPASGFEDLLRCAEQGHANSQYALGYVYANGDGVPEDQVLAYMWWNLSAAQGNELAREIKDLIEQRMTREQIGDADRLSREWIEEHPQDRGN